MDGHCWGGQHITCYFDADRGCFWFDCDGGGFSKALVGLPKGLPLRPWVYLNDADNSGKFDKITFDPPFSQTLSPAPPAPPSLVQPPRKSRQR